MIPNNTTVVGTAGGTFLSIVPNLHSEDVLRTVFLGAVGAVVSFFISLLLRYLCRKRRR